MFTIDEAELTARIGRALGLPGPMPDVAKAAARIKALAARTGSTAAEDTLRAEAARLRDAATATGHAALARYADDAAAQAAVVTAIKAAVGQPMTVAELVSGQDTTPRPDRRRELREELRLATAAGDAWRVDQITRDLQTEEVRQALHAPKRLTPMGDVTEAGVPFTDGPIKPERAGVQLVGTKPA
jgi:hypothetical protein